ncbi:MAG: hypothetical protein V4689_04610 [Verrucomicrobiota bacterium]
MKIHDTPALCAVGEGILASDAPSFDRLRSSVIFQPGNPIIGYKGDLPWMSPHPPGETWIFVQGKLDNGSGGVQSLWIREK